MRGASAIDMGTMAIGVVASGNGSVTIQDQGSIIRSNDNVWVGGGFGGVGGTGSLLIDNGGVISVPHITGINPALITVYPTVGTVTVRNAGLLTTPGTLDDRGRVTILDGEIHAQTVNMPGTGILDGTGLIQANFNTNGSLDPHEASNAVGVLQVVGGMQAFGLFHYVADLVAPTVNGCDVLQFSGTVALSGGTLDLRTPPGFVGHPGDTFGILTCGSRTGTFAAVTWNGAALAGQATIVYGANYIWVVIPGAATGVDPGTTGKDVTELRFAPAGGNARVAFALDLPQASDVQVKLFDLRGRERGTVFTGTLAAGQHQLEGRAQARDLPSGAYFARAVIQSGGRTTVRSARTLIVH